MSTVLHGQVVTWRAREKPRRKFAVSSLLRVAVVAAAITSALVYFVTRSGTAELVLALVRDAAPRPSLVEPKPHDETGAVVVSLRPSAAEGRLLKP